MFVASVVGRQILTPLFAAFLLGRLSELRLVPATRDGDICPWNI